MLAKIWIHCLMQLAGGQVILEVIMLMLFKSPSGIKVLRLQKCTAGNPICQTIQVSALSGKWPSRPSMPLGLLFNIKLNKCLYPCDTWTGYQLAMDTTLISNRKSIAAFKRFKSIHLLHKVAAYCSVRFCFLVVLTKTLPHRPDLFVKYLSMLFFFSGLSHLVQYSVHFWDGRWHVIGEPIDDNTLDKSSFLNRYDDRMFLTQTLNEINLEYWK